MNTQLRVSPRIDVQSRSVDERVRTRDWERLARDLDANGNGLVEGLLSAAECRALAGLYTESGPFRSRVVMGAHGFGRGEYKYFAYPLPPLVSELRAAFYPLLAPIAN